MHGSLVEPVEPVEAVEARPRRRLRTFESPAAFSRTCLRIAVLLAVLGVVGVLDRVWALCVVVLLLLFAGLARVVDLDGLVDEPDAVVEPRVVDPAPVERATAQAVAAEVIGPEAQATAPADPIEPEAPATEPDGPAEAGAEVAAAPEPDVPVAPERVRRTFRLPVTVGASTVHLVGDVNDWSTTATPMRREGAWFVTSLELEPGRSYRYRYLLDGARWENDWDADAYVPNGFGSDDSLVRT